MPVNQLQGTTNKIFSHVGTCVLRLNDIGLLIVSLSSQEETKEMKREK